MRISTNEVLHAPRGERRGPRLPGAVVLGTPRAGPAQLPPIAGSVSRHFIANPRVGVPQAGPGDRKGPAGVREENKSKRGSRSFAFAFLFSLIKQELQPVRNGTFAIVINPNKERCEAAKFQNYGETMTLPLDATRFLRCNRSSSQLIPTQHDTWPWITGRLGLGAPEHLSGRVLCRGGPAPPPAPPPARASSHAAPPLGSPGEPLEGRRARSNWI